MANKRNIFEIRVHPKEDIDLSSIHPALIALMKLAGEKSAEKHYAEQIQLKNESIREDGRHE